MTTILFLLVPLAIALLAVPFGRDSRRHDENVWERDSLWSRDQARK